VLPPIAALKGRTSRISTAAAGAPAEGRFYSIRGEIEGYGNETQEEIFRRPEEGEEDLQGDRAWPHYPAERDDDRPE